MSANGKLPWPYFTVLLSYVIIVENPTDCSTTILITGSPCRTRRWSQQHPSFQRHRRRSIRHLPPTLRRGHPSDLLPRRGRLRPRPRQSRRPHQNAMRPCDPGPRARNRRPRLRVRSCRRLGSATLLDLRYPMIRARIPRPEPA